jgi:DNA polymerase beta
MRTIAQSKGFTLSEYSIKPLRQNGHEGDPLPVTSEKDIFNIIGMEYKDPTQRNL